MLAAAILVVVLSACSGESRPAITISGSAVGAERALLERQIQRFEATHHGIDVVIQETPDDATQRHQLYVQWLNARVGKPDVLQLDVIWTPEFAAAGWILPLDSHQPHADQFFPAAIRANQWKSRLYAIPWFVDVGMLYWRKDLLDHAPTSMEELNAMARSHVSEQVPYGIVWQGARYEGLVTVFLEFLGGYGGRILDDQGRVVVDSPEAVAALEAMRSEIREGIAPREVLTWHEEECRFAFQNGRAAMMRNWPYAWDLMNDRNDSRVAGDFGVAPMPAGPGGRPTAALGGAELAINAASEHPDFAWELVEFLTAPRQMLERADVLGQYPARPALFHDRRLRRALGVPPADALRIIESATPRPVTPLWSQLSERLQVHLNRALNGQTEPADALHDAARQMQSILDEVP